MNWQELYSAILEWVKAATGLELAILEDEERPFLAPTYAILIPGPVTRVGMDWTGELEDEEGRLIPVRRGVREFVVTVAVESDSQRPALFGLHYAELLRTRGGLEEILAGTKAVNLALVDVGDSTPANYERDQHMVSRAEIPVRWRTTSVIVEESLPRDPIVTAETKGTFSK